LQCTTWILYFCLQCLLFFFMFQVPHTTFLLAHSCFLLYHMASNMTLRRLRHATAHLPQSIRWLFDAAWILAFSYFFAYLETLAIANVCSMLQHISSCIECYEYYEFFLPSLVVLHFPRLLIVVIFNNLCLNSRKHKLFWFNPICYKFCVSISCGLVAQNT
jgi:hypothetical protein